MQDKISAYSTLADLEMPKPRSLIVAAASALKRWNSFPAFRKVPIGTATTGVNQVRSSSELAWDGEPFLLQEPVDGPLAMAQSVFDRGRLVAAAANLRVREGAGGGASHKRSVDLPVVREHLTRLGGHLGWHGALSADVILGEDGPKFIDINPRLVEPGNAWRAGVGMVGALLDVAMGRSPQTQQAGRADVNTHQFILAVLGAARDLDSVWINPGRLPGNAFLALQESPPFDVRLVVAERLVLHALGRQTSGSHAPVASLRRPVRCAWQAHVEQSTPEISRGGKINWPQRMRSAAADITLSA